MNFVVKEVHFENFPFYASFTTLKLQVVIVVSLPKFGVWELVLAPTIL